MRSILVATVGSLIGGPLCLACLAARRGVTEEALKGVIGRIQTAIVLSVSTERKCLDCRFTTEAYAVRRRPQMPDAVSATTRGPPGSRQSSDGHDVAASDTTSRPRVTPS